MISGLPPDPAANFDGALSNVRPPWARKGEIDLEKNILPTRLTSNIKRKNPPTSPLRDLQRPPFLQGESTQGSLLTSHLQWQFRLLMRLWSKQTCFQCRESCTGKWIGLQASMGLTLSDRDHHVDKGRKSRGRTFVSKLGPRQRKGCLRLPCLYGVPWVACADQSAGWHGGEQPSIEESWRCAGSPWDGHRCWLGGHLGNKITKKDSF